MALPDWWTILLTIQIVAATIIFVLLSRYNQDHKPRMDRARNVVRPPVPHSLFELPAFHSADSKNIPAPFENDTWQLTFYEHVKLSIVGVTLFPLRFITCLAAWLSGYLLVFILQKSKRATRLVAFVVARIILACFGFYRIPVAGKMGEGAGVLVSNHVSFLDGILWFALASVRVFADQSNFKNPQMKLFAKAFDMVLFDRGGAESRAKTRGLMKEAAISAAEGKTKPVLVFPPGTTTSSKVLITFKDGAFSAAVPVQPACLHYKYSHCDPCWVNAGPGAAFLLFRMMCQLYQSVSVEFLPVCVPNEQEKKDPLLFARNVQHKMAAALNVPSTAHALEDMTFQLAALKKNLPAEVGIVGYAALKDVFSVDSTKIKEQMNVFKDMDQKGSGLVDFDGFMSAFARGFHEPSKNQVELLRDFFFKLTGGDAQLDFRKFLIGLALVNENDKASMEASTDTTPASLATASKSELQNRLYARLAFAAFAAESDDRISWNEFREMWMRIHPQMTGDAEKSDPPSPEQKDSSSPSGKPTLLQRLVPSLSGDINDGQSCHEKSQGDAVARAIFSKIAGDKAEECSWDKFSKFAEQTPTFVHGLRQATFDRFACGLSE